MDDDTELFEHSILRIRVEQRHHSTMAANNKDTLKIFSHIGRCTNFFTDHVGRKSLSFSLSNDDVIVKILNTVI